MNKNRVNPIDAIYDENNEENIVLYNENDEPVEFEQIAVIPIEDNVYVIVTYSHHLKKWGLLAR